MKRLLSSLVLLVLLALAAQAAPALLQGTFVGLEQGDYVHLNMKDDKGKERSFFLTNDPSFKHILANPKAFVGKRVEVKWHTIKKNIPEAGGPMTIEEALSIRVLKP